MEAEKMSAAIGIADAPAYIEAAFACAPHCGRPFFIALDGRSGVGKSTLADLVSHRFDALVIEGDDFYAGGVTVRGDSPQSRAAACIDWTTQRFVLIALRNMQQASWRSFDWEAFDGRLADVATTVEPCPVVVLEGVYSARPELSDLFDLRMLLTVPDKVRIARLAEREEIIGDWETQWHEAEEVYFQSLQIDSHFHAVICG